MDEETFTELTLKIEQMEYLLARVHAQISEGAGEAASPGLYLAMEKLREVKELILDNDRKEENEITQ